MAEFSHRRHFLQTSLAAGAGLGLGSAASTGDGRTLSPAQSAVNPHARPGRVRWHADFDAACAASRSSGKPVFLFHMMGRLDQKFC